MTAAPVSSTTASRPAAGDAPVCRFQEAMELTFYAEGDFPYLEVDGAVGVATLHQRTGGVRLSMELDQGGWRLRGHADPRAHDALYLGADVAFGEVLSLRAGAKVRVGEVAAASVEVRIPPDVLEDVGVERRTGDGSLVECGTLRMNGRAAVRPPRDGEYQELRVGRTPVAATPGGAEEIALVRTEPLGLRVREVQGAYARIELHHWSGLSVRGWVESARLTGPSGLMGMGSGSGSGGFTHCQVQRDVPVHAHFEGARAEVGSIAAGTTVRQLSDLDEEVTEVVVHPVRGTQFGAAPGVELRVPADALGECRGAGSPPRRAFEVVGALRGVVSANVPEERVAMTARVQRVRGLAGVRSGSACTIDLVHARQCRAEVRCGRHTLFGWVPNNGFFSCEFQTQPPRVVGEDAHTTAQSTSDGDPTLLLDTDRRILRMHDDQSGQHGAFELQAEIESVRHVPSAGTTTP